MLTKHFGRCNGEVVELSPSWENGTYIATEKGWILRLTLDGIESSTVKTVRSANQFAAGLCPNCGKQHFADRVISRPSNASNHKCDGRCLNARGKNCECSCKGKNHGAN